MATADHVVAISWFEQARAYGFRRASLVNNCSISGGDFFSGCVNKWTRFLLQFVKICVYSIDTNYVDPNPVQGKSYQCFFPSIMGTWKMYWHEFRWWQKSSTLYVEGNNNNVQFVVKIHLLAFFFPTQIILEEFPMMKNVMIDFPSTNWRYGGKIWRTHDCYNISNQLT